MSIFGFRRVADGGACEYCAAINGAYVKSADASPIHPHCGCTLEPLTEPHPGAAFLPDGTQVGDGYQIDIHGELGAVLGAPGDAFTTAAEAQTGETLTPLQRLAQSVNPDTATPDDLIKVGQAIIDQAVGPEQAQLAALEARAGAHESEANLLYSRLNAATMTREEFAAGHDAWSAAASRAINTRKQLRAAKAALTERRRGALVKALEEVRPMGGKIAGRGEKGVVPAINRHGAPFLPARWIERANANGPVKGVLEKGRAFYQHRYRGTAEVHIDPDGEKSTILHEITHRMEYTVPNVMRAENQFLLTRKARGATLRPLAKITGWDGAYKPSEVAYPGKFQHPYMGKIYDRPQVVELQDGDRVTAGSIIPTAGELLTMGQEGVWYGRWDLWEQDREMAAWILGLLAVL